MYGCTTPDNTVTQESKPIGEDSETSASDRPKEKPQASSDLSTERLSTAEEAILRPYLDDIRKGVRPFDANGVGICQTEDTKKRDCTTFLGQDAGILPPGSYMLQANVRVPQLDRKEGWNVSLTTQCTITSRDRSGAIQKHTKDPREKTYTVRYIGEKRGYLLAPLALIESPDPQGVGRTCTWKMVYHNPNGDQVVEGGWQVELPPAQHNK